MATAKIYEDGCVESPGELITKTAHWIKYLQENPDCFAVLGFDKPAWADLAWAEVRDGTLCLFEQIEGSSGTYLVEHQLDDEGMNWVKVRDDRPWQMQAGVS